MPDPEVMKELVRNRRPLVLIFSFLILIACLLALFALDLHWLNARPEDKRDWPLPALLSIPAYFSLESIGGAAAEALGKEGRWIGRTIAILALAAFYAIWFARVL